MQKQGYKDLARIYDLVNQEKDYIGEVEFLKKLFMKYNVKTVLDVGCGTGTHMRLLEKEGFECTGLDLNKEMLKVAEKKIKGRLIQADMLNFSLGTKFDAIICMYAGFNHLLNIEDAKKSIFCFKKHLNDGGILLIDLYNPQASGKKEDNFGSISRKMEWIFDTETRIEESTVIFTINGKQVKDGHTMRIYSMDEMLKLMKETGFSEVSILEGYGFKPAKPTSTDLEVFARLKK